MTTFMPDQTLKNRLKFKKRKKKQILLWFFFQPIDQISDVVSIRITKKVTNDCSITNTKTYYIEVSVS